MANSYSVLGKMDTAAIFGDHRGEANAAKLHGPGEIKASSADEGLTGKNPVEAALAALGRWTANKVSAFAWKKAKDLGTKIKEKIWGEKKPVEGEKGQENKKPDGKEQPKPDEAKEKPTAEDAKTEVKTSESPESAKPIEGKPKPLEEPHSSSAGEIAKESKTISKTEEGIVEGAKVGKNTIKTASTSIDAAKEIGAAGKALKGVDVVGEVADGAAVAGKTSKLIEAAGTIGRSAKAFTPVLRVAGDACVVGAAAATLYDGYTGWSDEMNHGPVKGGFAEKGSNVVAAGKEQFKKEGVLNKIQGVERVINGQGDRLIGHYLDDAKKSGGVFVKELGETDLAKDLKNSHGFWDSAKAIARDTHGWAGLKLQFTLLKGVSDVTLGAGARSIGRASADLGNDIGDGVGAIMNNGKDNESMREWALAKAATRNRLVSQFSGRAAEMDASMRSDPTYAKVVGAGVRNGDVPGLMVAQNVNRVELGGDQVLNQPPAVKKIDSLPKMPNHQMASAAGISKKHGYGLN